MVVRSGTLCGSAQVGRPGKIAAPYLRAAPRVTSTFSTTSNSVFLTNPQIFFANGIGVDSKDNVYVSFFTQASTTGVMEFKGGQMPGTVLKHIKNGAPGAIAFDKTDHLIITDDAAVTLNVYAPPYDKMPKTYPIQGHSPQCSLNKAQTNLACGDKTNTAVDIYSYPAGKYLYSFNNGLTATVIGTAQDPR
jgi:hypothetical protein